MGLFNKKKPPQPPVPVQPMQPAGAMRPAAGIPRPPPPGAMILAPDEAAARALDAADGVMDGRYFGCPVFTKGQHVTEGGHMGGAPGGYGQPYGDYPPSPPHNQGHDMYQHHEHQYHQHQQHHMFHHGHHDYQYVEPMHMSRGSYGIGDALDPHHYNGTVIDVQYVVHEPGWGGAGMPMSMPMSGYSEAPIIRHVEVPVCCGGGDRNRLPVPRSYPPRDHYDAPPAYEPPRPPPRYTPPPPPPRYEPPPPMPSYSPPAHDYNDYRPTVPTTATMPNMRPWFGVAVKWLDDLDQGGRDNVCVVHEVIPDSPAWKAGIQVDDQLEYWEDTKIDSETVWKGRISQIRIGDVINMGIHRNHRDQRVIVRIEGTNRQAGPSRMVASSNTAHTDN